MALLSITLSMPTTLTKPLLFPSLSSSSKSSSSSSSSSSITFQQTHNFRSLYNRNPIIRPRLSNSKWQRHVVCMAPEEEKMTRRSPLDFPIEWERPKPGRRPDIFPQFSPMKTPLPPPLPTDPPEEDEEEEEEKKEEEEEDPEKDEPENPEKKSLFTLCLAQYVLQLLSVKLRLSLGAGC